MGLLVLIVAGALLGWLAAIVMRIEERQDILLNLGTGTAGALLAGVLTSDNSLLGSLSANTLLAGVGGAFALLAIVNLVKRGVFG